MISDGRSRKEEKMIIIDHGEGKGEEKERKGKKKRAIE